MNQKKTWVWRGCSLLALHLMTSIRFQWEGLGVFEGWLTLSPDFLIVLGLGACAALIPKGRFLVCALVALLVLLIPCYRFGSTIMPFFYGKRFIPYEDIFLVPGFVHLLIHNHSVWIQGALLGGASLLILTVYALTYRFVVRALGLNSGGRRMAVSVLSTSSLLCLVWSISSDSKAWSPSVLAIMYEDAGNLSSYLNEYQEFEESLEKSEKRELPKKLDKLNGADVYLSFLESYGRAPFEKPSTRKSLERGLEVLHGELTKEGYFVISAWITPSVSGGGSGFAHAEFLTGQRVANKPMFARVLDSKIRPLPRVFAESGYRCINVQPAMTIDWTDSKDFFGFTDNLFQHHLNYEGYEYFWGKMPDQFALAQVFEREVRHAKNPLFVMYVSVTSHAPFNTIPPYYEDWDRCVRSGAFSEKPAKEYEFDWITYLSDPQTETAYVETLLYGLKTTVGFAKELTRPSMLIVLGDHQPPGVGDLSEHDTSYAVPIHIISNKRDLLVPIFAVGEFAQGFIPAADAVPFLSSAFFPAFANLFGSR